MDKKQKKYHDWFYTDCKWDVAVWRLGVTSSGDGVLPWWCGGEEEGEWCMWEWPLTCPPTPPTSWECVEGVWPGYSGGDDVDKAIRGLYAPVPVRGEELTWEGRGKDQSSLTTWMVRSFSWLASLDVSWVSTSCMNNYGEAEGYQNAVRDVWLSLTCSFASRLTLTWIDPACERNGSKKYQRKTFNRTTYKITYIASKCDAPKVFIL